MSDAYTLGVTKNRELTPASKAVIAKEFQKINSNADGTPGIVNVQSYGAVGDGSTDDTAAIQAALNAGAGNTVILPKGDYLTDRVLISNPNTRFVSQGGKLVAKPGILVDRAVLMVQNGASGSHIEGLIVDGNGPNQTNQINGIQVSAADVVVDACYVVNTEGAGIIATAPGFRIVNNTVRGGSVSSEFGIRVLVSPGTPAYGVVLGNVIDGTTHAAINLTGTQIVIASNTTSNTGGDGVAGYGQDNADITVVGNLFKNTSNHGVHLAGNRLLIADNIVENVLTGGHGYFVSTNGQSTYNVQSYDVTITGNVARNIAVGVGIRLDYVTRATVAGNTIADVVTAQAANVTNSFDVNVNGNTFVGVGNHGVRVGVTTGARVSDNYIKGGSGSAVSLNDSTSRVHVRDNTVVDFLNIVTAQASVLDLDVSGNTGYGITGNAYVLLGVGPRRTKRVSEGSSAPTTGTWAIGDIVWNTTPAAGGSVGWVCTAAGAPGSWSTFGAIAS